MLVLQGEDGDLDGGRLLGLGGLGLGGSRAEVGIVGRGKLRPYARPRA